MYQEDLQRLLTKKEKPYVVDNSRSFTRLVVARLHRRPWWQFDPSAVGCRTSGVDYQPCIRPQGPSNLEFRGADIPPGRDNFVAGNKIEDRLSGRLLKGPWW